MNRTVPILFCMGALLAASSCGDGQPRGADPCTGFRTELIVKDVMGQPVSVFNAGEEVRFEMRVTNAGQAPITVSAAASCSTATFEVTDSTGSKVWSNVDGIFCFAAVPPHTYTLRETAAYSANWQQQRSGVQPPVSVPAGQYSMAAVGGRFAENLLGEQFDCRNELTQTRNFTIQ